MRKLAMAMVATAGLALTAWQVGRAHEALTPFLLIVERTDRGVDVKCVRGCAWKFSGFCDKSSQSTSPSIVLNGVRVLEDTLPRCRFGVSERGVGPAPEDP